MLPLPPCRLRQLFRRVFLPSWRLRRCLSLRSLAGVPPTVEPSLFGAPVLAMRTDAPLLAVDVSKAVDLTGDLGRIPTHQPLKTPLSTHLSTRRFLRGVLAE